MKRIIYRILLLIWILFIFYMSHKPGEDSSEMSSKVIGVLTYIGVDVESIFGSLATFIVRKFAHITEYFVLAWLVFNSFSNINKYKTIILLTLILTVGYAITDEIHQLFVVGRSGRIQDVFIDSIGIITYIAIKHIRRTKFNK